MKFYEDNSCESATIEWQSASFDLFVTDSIDVTELDSAGFYALYVVKVTGSFTERILVYIGQTYEQTLRERIQQDHKSIQDCLDEYLLQNYSFKVKIGLLVDCSQIHVTQQFYDDVECCLIFKNQPKCNTSCRKSYNGRALIVNNMGYPWCIKSESLCNCVRIDPE